MSEQHRVRKKVVANYAKAVTETRAGACCVGPDPKSSVTRLAGYRREELETFPPDVVTHAMGCGDPVAFSGVKEGETVVDLGSGAGLDLLLAARKVGSSGRVIGVDMTGEMITKARENVAEAGFSNVEVRKGIIEDLPIESSSADWVISNCVINLSPEKPRVFSEIARVLKAGGQMLVSDIVAERLPDWVLQDEALYSSCVAGAISEAEYLAGLRRAGLEEIEVRGRTVYDAEQLEGFFGTDLADTDPAVADWISMRGRETLGRAAEALQGQIWSMSVYARKLVR